MRSNAASESLNRLAKLEARLAYGFRNPANQRRRVRIACTRGPTAPITHRNHQENTHSNKAETRSRLTSKNRFTQPAYTVDRGFTGHFAEALLLMQIGTVLIQRGHGYGNPAAVPPVSHILRRFCGVSYSF